MHLVDRDVPAPIPDASSSAGRDINFGASTGCKRGAVTRSAAALFHSVSGSSNRSSAGPDRPRGGPVLLR
jgi:hypothetical protein